MSFSPPWEFIKTPNSTQVTISEIKTSYGSADVDAVSAPKVQPIVVPDGPGRSHAVRIVAAAVGAACLWVATRD